MKKLLAVLLCAAFMFLPLAPLAHAQSGEEGFYVTGYDVKAVISQDNVYDVTETIKVFFTEPKHGIIREIPINREETRKNPDGTYSQTKVSSKVWDVGIKGYNFSANSDSDTCYIQIGDPDKLISGAQTYVISYKIGFGDDGSKDWDEAYYNIIGTGWPCTIDNATFSITLPEGFDSSKLGFSAGTNGESGYDTDHLKYSISGNTISGQYIGQLGEYEGITMRLELPEGYFNPQAIDTGSLLKKMVIDFILYCITGN